MALFLEYVHKVFFLYKGKKIQFLKEKRLKVHPPLTHLIIITGKSFTLHPGVLALVMI
jgi:hypothetical protein